MLTIIFLVRTAINIYSVLLLIRIWLQLANCDPYNSFTQSIIKATQPIVKLRIVPFIGPIDGTSLSLVFILSTIKLPLVELILGRTEFLPSAVFYLIVGLLTSIKLIGKVIFWVVTLRSLLSWVNQSYNPLVFALYQMSEVFMNPIRKILPTRIGIIDFSSMILIIIIYLFNYIGLDLFPEIWQYM
ncbi:hypothetical protein CRV09_03600 (plasmid) [Candidatus Pantoea edessiphila]|uniref:YggT family protein n=1 Tax=Candidatus Pantoea edessiphila TaxID=2044610 RepID=A0A2P5T171_9GAMM|nr:YggT family protein [Candidatus Pantoea edessiphila]PPI88316.1 hypothetical protein CRV09_03600 [Candidatus Pantoea edessiphila]